MKPLLIVLGCIASLFVAVVGGLYLAGRRGNGATHETSIDINAPPTRVWVWLSDGERVKRWVGGLSSIESLTPHKGLEVGARDRLLIEVSGAQQELFSEVTHIEAERSLTQRLHQDGALAWYETARFSLEPISGGHGTRFLLTASYTYTTIPGVIMEPIIRIAAGKKVNEDLARLKALVEADPQPGVGAPAPGNAAL